jgi:putative spermidine/putrescine transport system substrate-binding protein
MGSERMRSIRRRALAPLGLLGLAMLAQAATEQLTAVSWGGVYTRSQILGFVRDFERSSGIDVEMIDYVGGIEEIRSQVRAYNVKWDVVDLELFDAIRACDEGLLVEIDPASLPPAPDGTPATEDFVDGALMPCGVGNVAAATVIAYARDRFDRRPESIEDFFDLRRFPGQRALRRTPMTNLEWALIADGVDPDRVYEVLDTEDGVDRAFAMLDRIKAQIRWWELGEEAVRLLETDAVAMTSAYNGRIHSAVQRGEPFEILWDHHVRFWDVWGIPKHTENLDAALAFVRFATSTRSLANQAKHIAYGPLRRSSLRLLDAETLENLPTAEDNADSGFATNAQWWGENLAELQQRFDRWVERPVQVPKELPGR